MLERFSDLSPLDILSIGFNILFDLWPIWVPAILLLTFYNQWMTYKRREWIKEQGSTLLEIRVPRDIARSPQAMELFLSNLFESGTGTLVDVYLKGRVKAWFSLELVSIDGTVHFYIWTWKKFKGMIETQLYAQFPNIEVHEVPDYSLGVHYNPEKLTFSWFGQFTLTKADAYPIKTYIDYGLNEDPKEEFKHDPIVAVLEYLGSLRKGEQAWIQILIQPHTKEGLKHGRLLTKPDWKKKAEDEIATIRKKATPDAEAGGFPIMSKGQLEVIGAIERSQSKYAFDSMIRAAYFSTPESNNPGNIGGLLGSFRQFGSNTLNGFRPQWNAKYDYVFQDLYGKKTAENFKKLLEAYKRRSFFHQPFKNFKGKPFILTTEELATLFHFPSQMVAATPTLTRIPSKKAEAPSNLPI